MSSIATELLATQSLRPLRRLEYDRLVALGMFEDEKLELLGGMLVGMSPQGARDAVTVQRLTKLFVLAIGERAVVRVQLPFAAGADSEPEPDLAVVPVDDYSREHPSRALLVIEVADSSLDKDRKLKAAIYAAAGVPEFWLCDLEARTIEVRRELGPDGYARLQTRQAGDSVAPSAFPDVTVTVADVLPAR